MKNLRSYLRIPWKKQEIEIKVRTYPWQNETIIHITFRIIRLKQNYYRIIVDD